MSSTSFQVRALFTILFLLGLAETGVGNIRTASSSSLRARWQPSCEERDPVPDSEALEKARRELRETVYPKEFGSSRDSEHRELARRLLADSKAFTGASAERFVLLDEARSLATRSKDIEIAFVAIEQLGNTFAVDSRVMRVEALEGVLAKAKGKDRDAAISAALCLYESCLSEMSTDLAYRLNKALTIPLKKKRDKALRKRAAVLEDQLAECQLAKDALARLKLEELDQEANQSAGMYLCFRVGDFKDGLVMLGRGSNKPLAEVAKLDIGTERVDSEGCLLVASSWYGVTLELPAYAVSSALERARSWCQDAEQRATGFTKIRARDLMARINSDASKRAVPPKPNGDEDKPTGDNAPAKKPKEAAPSKRVRSKLDISSWAKVLREDPDKRVVTNKKLYKALKNSGFPWRIEHKASNVELLLVPLDLKKKTFLYVGKFEVQETEWGHVLHGHPLGRQHSVPAMGKLFGEVELFLSKAGGGLRLPTESEWETACRAGAEGDPYDDLNDVAWHQGNSNDRAHPVGEKEPNALGLHDMLGNAFEWCASDPIIARGGSWRHEASHSRVDFRQTTRRARNRPGLGLGFRVVRDVPSPKQP